MIELTTERNPEQQPPKPPVPTQNPLSMVKLKPIPIRSFEVKHFTGSTCTDKLSYMLVRPPKITYDERLLIPPLRDTRFKYEVLRVPFPVSLYSPTTTKIDYCLLYLHGNSSSKLQACTLIRVLPPNAALACFDFQGCGNREGQWITLGLRESRQVDHVVQQLEAKGFNVVLWGRSMGGVSALMSNRVTTMVVDSAFASLKRVCYETAKNNCGPLPTCMLNCLFPCVYSTIRKDILKKTGEDTDQLDVLKKVSNMPSTNNICFLSGLQDEMISVEHTKQLAANFKGSKNTCLFDGTHNSTRDDTVLLRAFEFIQRAIAKSQVGHDTKSNQRTELHLADLCLPEITSDPSRITRIQQ